MGGSVSRRDGAAGDDHVLHAAGPATAAAGAGGGVPPSLPPGIPGIHAPLPIGAGTTGIGSGGGGTPAAFVAAAPGAGLVSTAGLAGSSVFSATTGSPLVPTVFRWEHGGNNVYLTGEFNRWLGQPMHRSGADWVAIVNLLKGRHDYKFIVDGEWRFAPDQATVRVGDGRDGGTGDGDRCVCDDISST